VTQYNTYFGISLPNHVIFSSLGGKVYTVDFGFIGGEKTNIKLHAKRI